jgi:hypothetical protein
MSVFLKVELMTAIEISAETLAALQSIAIPLVDTYDSAIMRAVTALRAGTTVSRPEIEISDPIVVRETALAATSAEPLNDVINAPKTYDPLSPPNLRHTSLHAVYVDGDTLSRDKTYWNPAYYELIRRVSAATGLKGKALADVLPSNVSAIQKNDEGYTYLEDAGVSVQGRESNIVWRSIYEITELHDIAVEIRFTWQDNEKAAHPGESGRLMAGPVKEAKYKDFLVRQYADGSIEVLRGKESLKPVKIELRKIANAIGVNLNGPSGAVKNTRQLGIHVIKALLAA